MKDNNYNINVDELGEKLCQFILEYKENFGDENFNKNYSYIYISAGNVKNP